MTGGTGMLGSCLLAALREQGYEDIVLLVRSTADLPAGRFAVREVSLFDPIALTEALRGVDTLFHCAAVVSFGRSQRIVEENVRMTACVAEAALAAGVGLLVHVSSVATLAVRKYPELTGEEDYLRTLQGKNAYGAGKFFAENEVWRAAARGLRTVVVNPAVILGAGDWRRGTPAIFRLVRRCPWFYASGITGYVSARDAVRMMIALSEREEAVGQRFVLCAGNLPYKEFVARAARSVGRRGARLRLPDWILPRLLTEKLLYDGSRAAAVTGLSYEPLEETIVSIGRAYLER